MYAFGIEKIQQRVLAKKLLIKMLKNGGRSSAAEEGGLSTHTLKKIVIPKQLLFSYNGKK